MAALAVSVPTLAVVAGASAEAWWSSGSIAAAGGHGWLPYALLTGLLAVAALLSGAAVAPRRSVIAAIGLLLGLAAWAALTLEWSPVPSLARDEGLLSAFYALALAVPALTLRRALGRNVALAGVTVVLTTVALAVAATLAFGAAPLDRFSGGRLYFPITYANAQGAFFALAFWPAILLAARRGGSLVLRVAMSGAAATLLTATTLTQSKGTVLGEVAALVVVLAASPARLRLLVPLGIAALIDAAAFRPLTQPFRTPTDAAVRHAGLAVLVAGAAGLALGAAYAAIDGRISVGDRGRRTAGRVVGGLAVLVAVGSGAAFFLAVQHPGRWEQRQWQSFKHLKQSEKGAGSHFASIGSNRYDYWRVALREIEDHPLAGCGARCFGPEYLLLRRSNETPVRAHSLPLEIFAEQGIVGLALLASALGLLLTLLVRTARTRDTAATAALGTGVCWLAHSFVDWIWTFPAVTACAFAIVGIGIAQSERVLAPRVARSAAALAAALVVLAFAPVALAGWLTEHGRNLSLARRLDPVSTAPVVGAALRAPTPAEELALLRVAARMEPRVVSTQYFLGVAYLNVGRRREARAQLARALRLDPRNPSVLLAVRAARQ